MKEKARVMAAKAAIKDLEEKLKTSTTWAKPALWAAIEGLKASI